MEATFFEGVKTPCYAYDLKRFRNILSVANETAKSHGYVIHYAMKANANERILQMVKSHGMGVDCVSGQELEAAIKTGFLPNDIAFAGVGKADWEIDSAINHEIFTLNVESVEELVVIDQRAQALGKKAKVALRLNPDVNAKTHHYITTGLEENKFGISRWQLDELFELLPKLHSIELTGLHFHIGSQITDLEPFKNLCSRVMELQQLFADRGYRLAHINVGGGLGIDYDDPDNPQDPDFEAFFNVFDQFLELQHGQQLHFELGRALVAKCGDLISRVLYVKRGKHTNFLILDAGMTELIRPALYQSVHKIENWSSKFEQCELYDVVGPICESSDCFGKAIDLPISARGDIVAIRAAGAYGECMASKYNMRSLNPSIYFE